MEIQTGSIKKVYITKYLTEAIYRLINAKNVPMCNQIIFQGQFSNLIGL